MLTRYRLYRLFGYSPLLALWWAWKHDRVIREAP